MTAASDRIEILNYQSGAEGRIPTGNRLVVAYRHGRSQVTLLDCGALVVARVPLRELRFAWPAEDVRPRRLARRLEERRRQRKRHGLRHPGKAIETVCALLRGQEGGRA